MTKEQAYQLGLAAAYEEAAGRMEAQRCRIDDSLARTRDGLLALAKSMRSYAKKGDREMDFPWRKARQG